MRPHILPIILAVIPACVAEMPPLEEPPPIGGIEPQKPCAAVGYPEGSPAVQDRYTYDYDHDGRETWFEITYADGSSYLRRRSYRDGLLETERVATPALLTRQSFQYDDGLLDTGFLDATVVRPQALTTYWQDWTWRADAAHPALVEHRSWVPATGVETVVRYDVLPDGEPGFREETCTTGSPCAVIEYVGPHEYVGDTRGWTELRTHDGDPTTAYVAEERAFDSHGLVVSHARHDRDGALVEHTSWMRDDDGTMRFSLREVPGQPVYRYEPQYAACPL